MTASLTKPLYTLVIVLCLAGALLSPVNSYSLAESDYTGDLSALPLTFPAQSPEVIEYFNDIARPDDLVSFPDRLLQALPEVKAGQRMVSFASWEEAEKTIPTITAQIDWVLYNPEHWVDTPVAEQEDLPAAVQKAAKFLHARDLRLFLAPDRRYADEALDELALNADALMLQGQRLQNNPEMFASWMTEKIKIARAANPKILIYVQVGANQGTAEEMLRALQTVSDQIDGIAIWSTPRFLETLQAFVELLRPSSPGLLTETAPPSKTPRLPSSTPQPTESATSLALTTTHTPVSHVEDETPEPPLITPTPTPATGEQWLSLERLSLICLSTGVILLGVFAATMVIKANRKKTRSE